MAQLCQVVLQPSCESHTHVLKFLRRTTKVDSDDEYGIMAIYKAIELDEELLPVLVDNGILDLLVTRVQQVPNFRIRERIFRLLYVILANTQARFPYSALSSCIEHIRTPEMFDIYCSVACVVAQYELYAKEQWYSLLTRTRQIELNIARDHNAYYRLLDTVYTRNPSLILVMEDMVLQVVNQIVRNSRIRNLFSAIEVSFLSTIVAARLCNLDIRLLEGLIFDQSIGCPDDCIALILYLGAQISGLIPIPSGKILALSRLGLGHCFEAQHLAIGLMIAYMRKGDAPAVVDILSEYGLEILDFGCNLQDMQVILELAKCTKKAVEGMAKCSDAQRTPVLMLWEKLRLITQEEGLELILRVNKISFE